MLLHHFTLNLKLILTSLRLILTMTSEHDFCFSIFITFLWLYLCLAVWVKLVNHDTMLKVTHSPGTLYHYIITFSTFTTETQIFLWPESREAVGHRTGRPRRGLAYYSSYLCVFV